MYEYISEITSLVDALAFADDNTSNDMVLYTLAILGEDFESLVQNVTSRESDITFLQLQAMLPNLEIRKERIATKTPNPTMNAVTTRGNKKKTNV